MGNRLLLSSLLMMAIIIKLDASPHDPNSNSIKSRCEFCTLPAGVKPGTKEYFEHFLNPRPSPDSLTVQLSWHDPRNHAPYPEMTIEAKKAMYARIKSQGLQSDSYWHQYWYLLHTDPEFQPFIEIPDNLPTIPSASSTSEATDEPGITEDTLAEGAEAITYSLYDD